MAAPLLPHLPHAPAVADLLAVDRVYRRRAREGDLPRIAPRRFNPEHEAWLPIYHDVRGGFRFTALFSNTARAHHLHRVQDWVVIAWEGPEGRGQATVVTEFAGPLRGRRVVRGRERECLEHYHVPAPAVPASTNGNGII